MRESNRTKLLFTINSFHEPFHLATQGIHLAANLLLALMYSAHIIIQVTHPTTNVTDSGIDAAHSGTEVLLGLIALLLRLLQFYARFGKLAHLISEDSDCREVSTLRFQSFLFFCMLACTAFSLLVCNFDIICNAWVT